MSGYKAGADGADGAEGPAVKDAAVGERAVAEEAESVSPATCILANDDLLAHLDTSWGVCYMQKIGRYL